MAVQQQLTFQLCVSRRLSPRPLTVLLLATGVFAQQPAHQPSGLEWPRTIKPLKIGSSLEANATSSLPQVGESQGGRIIIYPANLVAARNAMPSSGSTAGRKRTDEPLYAQEPTLEEKQQVDAAIPSKALGRPKKPRRILVSNLTMRDGRPWRSSSSETIPIMDYAIEQLGKRTGAYQAVFSNDIEMLRPAAIRQFDAICFANTAGVLFEDEELRKSLLAFIAEGKGFVGIHDAIATFVQYPKYDQWPAFGQMLGGTENGGHPWDGEVMTIETDDPSSPLTSMFRGVEFKIADQAFQLQEPAFRDRVRVLLSVDVTKTPWAPKRRILPARQADKDFPVSWVRAYAKGRVFYCGLGHGREVFWNPKMIEHILAGIQYALGDLKANDKPILKR